MKKTALQQAIDKMSKRLKYSESAIVAATMSRCISICEQHIQIEREQIKDAYNDGHGNYGIAERYYEKTYGE